MTRSANGSLLDPVFTEENFQKIVEYAPIGIVIIDGDLKWKLVNKKFCEITGFSKEELLRKTFIDITHPDDVKLNMNWYLKLLSGEVNEYEYEKRYIRKDGNVIWVRLNVSAVRMQGEYSHMIALVQDVDENKRYRHALELKNKELDLLFYKASHDLKSPVTTLEGLCNLLKGEVRQLEDSDSFRHLHLTVERLKAQNEALLLLTRINERNPEFQQIPLGEFMGSKAQEAGLRPGQVEVRGEEGSLRSDRYLLGLALRNIFENARIHSHPRVPLKILVEIERFDAVARITVSDNGIGIAEEFQEKVFEMFFRGSGESPGSGLGLYLAKKGVEKLHGEISLRSKPFAGAAFVILLPAN